MKTLNRMCLRKYNLLVKRLIANQKRNIGRNVDTTQQSSCYRLLTILQ